MKPLLFSGQDISMPVGADTSIGSVVSGAIGRRDFDLDGSALCGIHARRGRGASGPRPGIAAVGSPRGPRRAEPGGDTARLARHGPPPLARDRAILRSLRRPVRDTEAKACELAADDYSRICGSCGRVHFPRISPAIILLIRKGERALLAHNARFRPGFFGRIAGFVEAGETLEEAAVREAREEVGHRDRLICAT